MQKLRLDQHMIEELPPSAKLVYKILEIKDEPCTAKEIAEASFLTKRTVNYGLNRLQEKNIVTEQCACSKPGTPTYTIARNICAAAEC